MAGTTFSPANWGTYDTPANSSNPGSTLTDFTHIIDVSQLSAAWKAAVQSDGGDIRITKEDGTTELPYDLIDWAYNAGSPTGHIRCKYTGSLLNTTTQKPLVWCDYTLGTAVAYDANETYGSDNAYNSGWWAYWPLHDLDDRTANARTLIKTAALTMGGVSGQVTPATDFDGTNDWCRYVATWGADTTDISVLYWQHLATADVGADGVFGSEGASASNDNIRGLAWSDTNLYFDYGNTSTGRESASYTSYLDKWSHVACVSEGAGGSFKGIYFDGSVAASDTGSSDGPSGITGKDFFVGRAYQSLYKFNGSLNDFQVHQVRRTADWIAEEFAQTNNNATYWGTWTNTTAGGATEETHSAAVDVGSAFADRVIVADSLTGAAELDDAPADTSAVGEAITSGVDAGMTVADGVTAGESLTSAVDAAMTLADRVDVGEAITPDVAVTFALSIGGAVSVSIGEGIDAGASLSDRVNVTEDVMDGVDVSFDGAIGGLVTVSIGEGVGVGDALDDRVDVGDAVSEGAELAEVLSLPSDGTFKPAWAFDLLHGNG